jgi:hypothetical protein
MCIYESKIYTYITSFSANTVCTHTVRKMGPILRSIERMLKMQFSMARKFTRLKPPKKPVQT